MKFLGKFLVQLAFYDRITGTTQPVYSATFSPKLKAPSSGGLNASDRWKRLHFRTASLVVGIDFSLFEQGQPTATSTKKILIYFAFLLLSGRCFERYGISLSLGIRLLKHALAWIGMLLLVFL